MEPHGAPLADEASSQLYSQASSSQVSSSQASSSQASSSEPSSSQPCSEMPSSPPAAASEPAHPFLSPTRSTRPKEKRVPSVTPRRFRSFFTPRTFAPRALPPLTTRMTLGTMDSSAVNRVLPSPQSLAAPSSDPICPSSPTERLQAVEGGADRKRSQRQSGPAVKRRRAAPSDDEPQPMMARPRAGEKTAERAVSGDGNGNDELGSLSERRKATLSQFFKASRRGVHGQRGKLKSPQPISAAQVDSATSLWAYRPQPVRKFRNRGFEAGLLDREHGFASHVGKQYLAYPASDPRTETADFHSDSADSYHCTHLGQAGTSIPFSLASCSGAPVTAIGDEQGNVRFFSTAKLGGRGDGDKVTSAVKVHDNAIVDLDFSGDDGRLASACGDRSGRVLDTQTQAVAVELGGGHWDSLRQVRFQPGRGGGSVLASSDRAGRVQVWDLRCSGLPAQCFSSGGGPRDERLGVAAARTVKTIDGAHERTVQGSTSSASVTALQWLPAGREHLLLTGSEAKASVKLWDTRYIKPRRQAAEAAVAATPEPATHAWRPYGITSLALGADAARLYAVCKDSTVYAYSTGHLLLGHAPELLDGAAKRRPLGAEGLGPLYGLRHDRLRVASFYVKCAVRPGGGAGGAELLAVGSSDACAVLFPTDERYLRAAWARREHVVAPGPAPAPSPFALPSPMTPMTPTPPTPTTPSSPPPWSTPPVLRAGTALVRGHGNEVTTLSWACDGKLVTASDDCLVRHWQRDARRARHLRRVGEFGGERHLAGWADVGDGWDGDDDEDGC